VSGWVPALLQRDWRDSLETGTVAAGDSPHSLFVHANGALMVYSLEGEAGTLGLPKDQDGREDEDADDDFRTVLVPTPVRSMAGIRIRQVVAGFKCSLALTEAGQVYMWGEGGCGRLASNEEDRLVPTLIQELGQHRVRQLAVGHGVCAAVTEEGLLFTWATAGSEGPFDAYADTQQGPPQLGLGLEITSTAHFWPPQCVTALQGERVGSVAVGDDSTLVSTESGAVFSFGGEKNGGLGHGDDESQFLPSKSRRWKLFTWPPSPQEGIDPSPSPPAAESSGGVSAAYLRTSPCVSPSRNCSIRHSVEGVCGALRETPA
jgi:alpha-tubulin suppressor-like RCC1 family protein